YRAVGFVIEWRAKNRPVDEAFQSCWNVAVECVFIMQRWRKVTTSSVSFDEAKKNARNLP
ncbi:MAG TPA: hypothetical protein VLS45_05785, partial [Methylomicrobium sp.]|nr:hypothetical protein [Methylomicrobium sp.]